MNESEISEIKKEPKENNTNFEDKEKEKEKDKDKEKEKKEYIINKPLDLENVDSTLKTYFNENKGYKGNIQISHKQLKVHPIIKIHTEENEVHKNKFEKKKNKSFINKEDDKELSAEEEKITSIKNKKNELTKKENIINSPKVLNKISEVTKEKNIKTTEIKKPEKENYKLNIFVNKRKLSENTTEKKESKDILSINSKKYNKSPNIYTKQNKTLTNNNTPVKIETINSDKGIFSKEQDINPKIISKSKFSFLTNINNVKETSKNDINSIEPKNTLSSKNLTIGEENTSVDFAILNKKISKMNNRLTELYMDSDQKINKVYQYVKTVFDHLSGVFFFKDLYNQKFSFDFTQKNLITQTEFSTSFPTQKNSRTKIVLKGKNKIFSANNIKNKMPYRTIVNKIEPYLIKKFKD